MAKLVFGAAYDKARLTEYATVLDAARRHEVDAGALPAFPVSARTDCNTPWPPKPSTAACAWKPSLRCSATRRWR